MSLEKIKSEILKENPNWLLVSTLAKEIHENQLETNTLGFKKGIINIIKVGQYDNYDFYKEIKSCFESDEYHYIANDDVREFNKWLASKPNLSDKYHIVITSKANILSNSLSEGYECNLYKGGIRLKYDKKSTKFILKNDNIDISFEKGCLKQEVRNITLNKLFN